MLNYLLAKFQNPNKGFDPISKKYAKKYFDDTYKLTGRIDRNLLELLKSTIELNGKKVVDLGAGPGQYTLLLAKEGAQVHYHDISHNFVKLAIEKAAKEGYSFTHTIDYIDYVNGPYDVIFNRGAFNYCFDDKKFIDILNNQLNKGGIYFGILVNENQVFSTKIKSWFSKTTLLYIQFWLNDLLNIKLGHPFTSKRKIKKIFEAAPFEILRLEDYGIQTLVIARKQ
jgi:2-polyprenyl-3-methyl-5-hydroxy-6-metoxy-1,4-benzoquinol methylase